MSILAIIVKHCITGIDGETYDPARIYGALAVLTFLFLSMYSVIFNHATWDAQEYGIGFGSLLLGFGLGVIVKSTTEPPEVLPPTDEHPTKGSE